MSWARMAWPLAARADQRVSESFTAALDRRLVERRDLTDAVASYEETLDILLDGWEWSRFPDYPNAITVHTNDGWVYVQSAANQFGAPANTSTSLLAMRVRRFGFLTLGDYAQAALTLPHPSRLASGIWALIEPHVSAEELSIFKVMVALGGELPIPDTLAAVGGLPAR